MIHFINQTRGKIFSVLYVKKDGTKKTITCRTGVKKGITGVGRAKPLADHLVCIYDVNSRGHKTLIVENILQFKCGITVV